MTNLLTIRDEIKTILSRYDYIATPCFRFVLAFVLFISVNHIFGYSASIDKIAIIFMSSVVCAFLSVEFMVLIAGLFMLVHTFAVGIDVAAVFFALFLIMYCSYLRFFPKCGIIMILIPLLYSMNLQYAIPILVGFLVGPIGLIPAAFGVVLHYFSVYLRGLTEILATATEEDTIQGFNYILTGMFADKDMIFTIVVFCVVIVITYALYHMPMKYAWIIAIVSGDVMNMILLLMGSFMVDSKLENVNIMIGSVMGIVVAVIIQFVKGIVDYSRTEVVQFEDDDYYYYVKAVPKLNVSAEHVNVKKIHTRGRRG